MKIRSFAHKGLQRLYEDDNAKGVPPGTVDKLRKIFAFLDALQHAGELRALTANRRLTFWIDTETQICDLNSEDYH